MERYGTPLAVLTVIGGLDDRPRVGGLVQHEELGTGTVTSIPNRSKVVVFFHVRKSAKLCPLNSVKTVSDLYVWSHGVMVSTLDFESNDPSSSLGGTCFFFFCFFFIFL